jgi:hypothetical protein
LPLAAVLQMNQHLRQCAWCRERYESILDQGRLRLTNGPRRSEAKEGGRQQESIKLLAKGRQAFRDTAGWMGAAAGFLFAVAFLYAASHWVGARYPEPLPAQASARTVPPPPAETAPPAAATTVLVEPAVNPVEPAPRRRTRRPQPKPAAPAPAVPPPADPSSLMEPVQLARMELPLGRFASVLEPPAPAPPQKVAIISGLGPEPVAVPVGKPPRAVDLPEAAVIIHNLGPDPLILPVRRQHLPTLALAGQ